MKNFFGKLFNDNNTINEKAVIGFLAFCMMCIFAIADIVTGAFGKQLIIEEFIFDSFKILTIACFGIASIDKWINKDKNESEGE